MELTQVHMAELLGVTTRALRKWHADGLAECRTRTRGLYDGRKAVEWYVEHAYRDILRRLLDSSAKSEENGQLHPHTIPLAHDALGVLYDLEQEIENELVPGGRMSGAADWAAKEHGQAVRLAGLLHLWERAELDRPLWDGPIGSAAMAAAVRIIRALSTHTLSVYGELGKDPKLALSMYVLRRAREFPDDERSLRDLFERAKGKTGVGTVEDLRAVVDHLETRGCLRISPVHSTGPGRPPSYLGKL